MKHTRYTYYQNTLTKSIVFLLLVVAFMQRAIARENHALLIGVSHYSNFPEKSLKGPANDVRLMQEVLLEKGFDENNIKILADGITMKFPTQTNIFTALDDLISTVAKDDFVYIHFAGHGSQQPVTKDKSLIEPDRLDEIFLPRDIGN